MKKKLMLLPVLAMSLGAMIGCNNHDSDGKEQEDDIMYTVHFDSSGGSNVPSQKVKAGEKAEKPDDPVKTGYSFDGWFSSSGEVWVFQEYPVMEDMTLTAQWDEHVYSLFLDANGGTIDGEATKSLSLKYLENYSLSGYRPSYYGHVFAGWYTSTEKFFPEEGTFTYYSDVTLHAKWDPLYTVSFDSAGGSPCDPIEKFDYEPITSLPVPTRDGGTFEGWYLDDVLIMAPYTPADYKSVTLTAHWELATESFIYQEINNATEIEILSYIGSGTEIVVPDTIGGKNVTSIAKDAFRNKSDVTMIDLGKNVTCIGDNCMLGCSSLQTLKVGIPSFVLLAAFNYDSSNLPESFTTIVITKRSSNADYSAFTRNTSRNFDVVIGKDVDVCNFTGCSCVKDVTYEEGTSMTRVYGFGSSSVCSVTIPEGFTTIEGGAFKSASRLTSINIPDSVTSIGSYAFYECSSLASLHISSGITKIEEYSFTYCNALTSVVIPDSVTTIGRYAFSACTHLRTLALPENLTSIGEYGFNHIGAITVSFPKGIKNVSDGAFNWCENIRRVYFEGTASEWYAVSFASGNDAILNAETVYETSGGTFREEENGTFSYLIGENDDVILDKCLDTEIETANLNDSFKNKNVFMIESNAFRGCKKLTSIVLPDGLSIICGYAFYYCTSLLYVSVPEGTKIIEDCAFSQCSSLVAAFLPASLTSVGNAFGSLTRIYYEGTEQQKSSLFSDSYLQDGTIVCNSEQVTFESKTNNFYDYTEVSNGDVLITSCKDKTIEKADIAAAFSTEGDIVIGKSAFAKCKSMTSVVLPENLVLIGTSAFSECSSLLSVTLPSSVTSIGNSAFACCTSMTSIFIPVGVTYVGGFAFGSCSNLNVYCEAESQPSGWNDNWNYDGCPVTWGYTGD